MNFLYGIIYGLLILFVVYILIKYLIYSEINDDGVRYKHVKLNCIDIFRIMHKLFFVYLSTTENCYIYTDRSKQYKSESNCTNLIISDTELFLEYKRVNDNGDVFVNGYFIDTDIVSYSIIQCIHKYNVYLLKLNRNKFINKRELPEI